MKEEEKDDIRARVADLMEKALEAEAPMIVMTILDDTLVFSGIDTHPAEMMTMLDAAQDAVMADVDSAGRVLN